LSQVTSRMTQVVDGSWSIVHSWLSGEPVIWD
jgi:hypothetical protein